MENLGVFCGDLEEILPLKILTSFSYMVPWGGQLELIGCVCWLGLFLKRVEEVLVNAKD
ncbi:MAG: hypothetical protein NZM25_06530 [Leptospiraceae bacterium]|nr:hypothetical protein [Leptospiraceae bacterium]